MRRPMRPHPAGRGAARSRLALAVSLLAATVAVGAEGPLVPVDQARGLHAALAAAGAPLTPAWGPESPGARNRWGIGIPLADTG